MAVRRTMNETYDVPAGVTERTRSEIQGVRSVRDDADGADRRDEAGVSPTRFMEAEQ